MIRYRVGEQAGTHPGLLQNSANEARANYNFTVLVRWISRWLLST